MIVFTVITMHESSSAEMAMGFQVEYGDFRIGPWGAVERISPDEISIVMESSSGHWYTLNMGVSMFCMW